MNKIININVDDSYVKGDGCVIGAKGSGNDVTLRIKFNSPWLSLAITGCWQNSIGEVLGQSFVKDGDHYDVIVPGLAKSESGYCTLTIKGSEVDTHELYPTVDSYVWESSSLGGQNGDFEFVKGDIQWYLDGSPINIGAYGITYVGDAIKNDKIIVTRESGDTVSVSASAIEYRPTYKVVMSTKAHFRVLDGAYELENYEIMASNDAEVLLARFEELCVKLDDETTDMYKEIDELRDDYTATKAFLETSYENFTNIMLEVKATCESMAQTVTSLNERVTAIENRLNGTGGDHMYIFDAGSSTSVM